MLLPHGRLALWPKALQDSALLWEKLAMLRTPQLHMTGVSGPPTPPYPNEFLWTHAVGKAKASCGALWDADHPSWWQPAAYLTDA